MDEKDLQIFLTLADTGNLTRTAEKLYLAQPTLSKRLQNMESELGATLFLRSKQGVTLTPAGEEAQKESSSALFRTSALCGNSYS